jgi:hypothetical protein
LESKRWPVPTLREACVLPFVVYIIVVDLAAVLVFLARGDTDTGLPPTPMLSQPRATAIVEANDETAPPSWNGKDKESSRQCDVARPRSEPR